MKKILTFCIVWMNLLTIVRAETASAPKLIFEENKNQWPSQVLYEADFSGGKLFLEKNVFTYLLIEKLDMHEFRHLSDESLKIRYHSFKVNFENANPDVKLTGNSPYSFHRNYYLGNDSSRWASGVKLYEEVTYHNLYPSIDVQVYNADKNLKYDFIVHPQGNPDDIHFSYQGADKLYLKNGNLYIQTSLGDIVEQKPYCYQIIDGTKKEIPCSYRLKSNTISFSINKQYDKSLPLIIDPVLVASTYTGSFADNWGFTATYDNAGNIYSAGIAASAGYPTTLGAFDNTFNGGMPWTYTSYPFDISITKYNANGTSILYSTYFGGSLNEQPHSLIVNNNNELYVAGRTNSPNFPFTTGVYDASFNGGYDIIVAKFNTVGNLMASTFVGGTGDDGVNIHDAESVLGSLKFNYADDGRSEIILDDNSNVYVAGSTRSTNFPTSPGAFDATLSGTQDGCVFKMNSSLSTLTFSTYLGGSADDAAYGIKLIGNDVYVTGGTASSDFPTTSGVLNPTYQGGAADGFITAFNSTGTSAIHSTYIGTSAYDQSYLIETDANNDIYVYGQTQGAYTVTPGVYSNPNSGQFIHKLNNQLSTTIFSTVIGSGTPNPNISPTAFLVDSCQSIYIAGWARCAYAFNNPSPSTVIGMPITPNAFQSTTDGCDFYFMVLRPNAQSLLYATYFGENSFVGDHVDGGTSRFDKRGFIYQSVCASCGSTDNFPTTPTAWSRTNNSFNCNNAVVKMDLQVNPEAIASITGSPNGCVPYTVTFGASGSIGTSFTWDFGDGSPRITGPAPPHTYTNVGTYIATLYVSDSTGTCGNIDSAKITINVADAPALQTTSTPVFCNGGSNGTATVTASGGNTPYTYLWNNGQTNATANGLTAGSYSVTVTNSYGCSSNAVSNVTQPNVLSVNASFTNVSCNGGSNGTATATVTGGTAPYTYTWLPGGFTTSSVSGLSIGSYTVSVKDSLQCTTTATVNITQPPALAITASVTNAGCSQSNGSITVTGSGGFAPYSWSWAGGQPTATITGLAAGTYTVTMQDLNLCTHTIPVSVANATGPVASIIAVDVSCNGLNDGTATITTTGGNLPFTYLWSNGQTTPTATNLSAGLYSVLVTDSHNCSATASTSISEPPLLIANAVGTSPSCDGFADGSVQASALGGTAPYSYLWAIQGNPTNNSISNVAAGVYNVSVTDAKGCIKLTSVTLANPPAVAIAINTTPVLCSGDCTGTATATASNGLAPYTYQWNDSQQQATPTATNLCSGTYSVAVTDAKGCPANAAAYITAPLPLTTSVFTKGNPTCNGMCNGFAQIAVTGGTPPYTYNWLSGGQTTASVTALCAGTFTCSVTDANGCSALIIDSLQEPQPLIGAVNVVKIPCNGVCNGEIIATYSGGNPPYNYLWQPGLQTTAHPTTLCAGTTTVTVTDSLGCSATGSIVLTEPPALTATVSTVSSNCGQTNGSACVVVSGGTLSYKYQWSSGATDTLDCVSGLTANSYSVTIKDGMGCTLVTSANISDITGPTVNITNTTNPDCYGIATGTATTNITGGVTPYTYSWFPDGQTVANPTNLAAGINSITVTDNAGCIGTASVTISTPPQIMAAFPNTKHVTCFGTCNGEASILYGGGTGTLSIVWDAPGNPTTDTLSALCAGIYKLTITDSNSCTRIDSVTIHEPALLQIQGSTITHITCNGDNNGTITAGIQGGSPPYSISWTPNVSTNVSATNLVAGSYTIVVSDSKTCSTAETWTINEPPPLSITNSVVAATCNFPNGSATVAPNGGTTPYFYQWNDINLQTTAQAQNLSSGNYICTVRDTNNCTITDTATVTMIAGPAIDSITSTDVLCNGGATGTATVFLNSNVGTPPYTYQWSPTSNTGVQATGLSQGVYNVFITDSLGCPVSGTVVVNQPPALLLMVSPADTVCYRDTAQVYAQGVGGVPNYLYSWYGAGFGFSGTGPHLVLPDSNSVYSVIVADANGCTTAPLDILVVVPPPLSLLATPDASVCDGDSTTITAMVSGGTGNPYIYNWSTGDTTQAIIVSPPLSASPVTYTVEITDGCSQPVADTLLVTVNTNPTGSFTQSDTTGCEPLTITFQGTSPDTGATFSWDFGDSSTANGDSVTHTFTGDTTYSISMIVTSSQGCSATIQDNSAVIVVHPKPDANFSVTPIPASSIYPIVDFMDLSTTTIVSWAWDFNDPASASNTSSLKNPSHTYSGTGIYTTQLIVTNQYGCLDTANNPVEVIDDFVFYAPNTFTPDENTINDLFLPLGVGWDISTYELYIFDRWGELIFYTEDYQQGWNGVPRNGTEVAQIDVYVWKVKLNDLRGNPHKYIGHVTLLK